MANEKHTAKIHVLKPCSCGLPWFSCSDRHGTYVTTYRCAPVDYDPAVPHPAHVAFVRERHPDADLVYLDV